IEDSDRRRLRDGSARSQLPTPFKIEPRGDPAHENRLGGPAEPPRSPSPQGWRTAERGASVDPLARPAGSVATESSNDPEQSRLARDTLGRRAIIDRRKYHGSTGG